MSITWLLLSALSLAGAPEREERSFSGSGRVNGGNVSLDGSLVSFVSGGEARVISTETWQETQLGDCTVTSATPVANGASNEIWVGCSDGTIQLFEVDGRSFVRVGVGDDLEDLVASSDGESVIAMHASPALVYAILDGDVSSSVTFDPTAEVPVASAAARFNWTGFKASTFDGNFVHIAHDLALMSSIQVGGNNPLPANNAIGLVDVDDLAPTSVLAGQPLGIEQGRGVAPYSVTSRGFLGTVINDTQVRAVGVSLDTEDEWAVVAYEDGAEVLDVNAGNLDVAGELLASFDVDHAYSDIVVTSDGYALGAATDGSITVMSDRPFVTLDTNDLGSVVDGDSGTLSVTSDRAGSWVVQLGGSVSGGGTELATGDIDAGSTVEVPYSVDSTWVEGDIDVFVRVTDASGRVGHSWAAASVDAAPGQISVSRTVSFGDEKLTLSFTALEAEDIDTYAVYISDQAFEAADFPEGGPEYAPEGLDFEGPIEVTEFSAGEGVEVVLSPLENGTTYYLAVRATDSQGKEGPMSDVVTGRPRETQTASERAGDPGGAQCNGLGAGAAWLGVLGLGLVGIRRRRRGVGVLSSVLAAGVVLAALLPAAALAADDKDADEDEEPGPPQMSEGYEESIDQENKRTGDLTDAWGNAELRFGYWSANEPAFEEVFGGPSSSQLQFEIGPQIYRVLEIDVGAGIVMRNGETIATDDQAKSGEETRLMIFPLSLSATPRLHILDEQAIVPYVSLGADWWLWREREGGADAAGKVIRSGSHIGWHWELGLNILLDTIDRRRASLLEAQAGINDSWITIGYRRQTDLVDEGFDFGGNVFHVGLKLDF